MSRGYAAAVLIAAFVICALSDRTAAQGSPPKTIADILALLEGEKPDPAKLAKLSAAVDAEPPQRASAPELMKFYLTRSEARQVAGRLVDAREDADRGLAID